MSARGPGHDVELTTTRIGGGLRARIVAVATAVVLGGVVYLGWANRSDSPGSRFTAVPAQPVAVASRQAPTASAPASAAPVVVVTADPTAQRPARYLRAGLRLRDKEYFAILREVFPNHWHAAYRVEIPTPAREARLRLGLADETSNNHAYSEFGRWIVPLDTFDPLNNVDHARPVEAMTSQLGYRFEATLERQVDHGVVNVDVYWSEPPL